MITLYILDLSVVIGLYLVVLPVAVPLHFVLKANGRRGFVRKEVAENGRLTWLFPVTLEGFKKAPH